MGSPTLDEVLALTTEDLLKRRLQWIAFTRGLAPTVKGARKWIVHGHFSIGDHRVTRPGDLVPFAEEGQLAFTPTSPLASEDHAVRVIMRERAERGSAPVAPTPPPEGV